MVAHLWLWLGRWAAARGLAPIAESCFRKAGTSHSIIGSEALLLLGKELVRRERFDEAKIILGRATAYAPDNAKIWCAWGTACRRAGDMALARQGYEQALALDPGYMDARVNLGEWHLVSGNAREALDCFDTVLVDNPAHHESLVNRIVALATLSPAKAEQAAVEALALFPGSDPLHVNLGNVYVQMAKPAEAAIAYRNALELNPASEDAALGLAMLTGDDDSLDKAIELLTERIAIHGASVDRLSRLASIQFTRKLFSAARTTCEQILHKQPDNALALVLLGCVHSDSGDSRAAIECYEAVIGIDPDSANIHSNILFESTYLGESSPEDVFRRHLEWASQHEAPLLNIRKCTRPRHSGDENVARDVDVILEQPLKIGYVSGDLGSHPVGILLRDVLRYHDKRYFEVYCYSQLTRPDAVTEQIRSCADRWVESFRMNDEELAERIVQDGIDILVDLSGHTADNRLNVFAMRPAPIQASWIGYFHSTGLQSIDYFITDPYSSPLDGGQLFTETPVYLPNTRFCYSPPDYAPPVADAPCLRFGHVTFGSFNRLPKLTDAVVRTWARILLGVPGSRLVLKTTGLGEPEIRDRIVARFSAAGLSPERLELRDRSRLHREMYEQYGDIDIALDSFPFNGGMTTLEALWMGVPVITLAGDSLVSRQSVSALANIGLSELAFPDEDAYVAGAIALAGVPARLQSLRQEIRQRMMQSPLCQPRQFAADLENLYRRMWQAWCRGEKLESRIVASTQGTRTLLHVGCGMEDVRSLPAFFQNGWKEIRLDIDPACKPDIVASILNMSTVGSASADAIFSSHNIEHFYAHEVRVVLAEFRRVLKPDGVLVMTCPDLQSICTLVADDRLEDSAYSSPAGEIAPIDMLYGLREAMAVGNLFMAHKTGFTASTLAKALKTSGFQTVLVERKEGFNLWALAYPGTPTAECVGSDKQSCFPS